jgi:hypothetical protein
MTTQPIPSLKKLVSSWRRLLAVAVAATSIATIPGCGGSADQTIVTLNGNTPLILSNFTGLRGYSVGSAQVYSVTVKDPDGISSVAVKLDGENIPVTQVGDVYSVSLPSSITAGTHSIIFTARGKSTDGTLEVPISEGINFTVFQSNTPLTIGAIQGLAAYTLGTAQTYTTNIIDPNGIASVSATLNGQPIAITNDITNPSNNANNNASSQYRVTIPANTPAGNSVLRIQAIGKQPDAANETAQSAQFAFTIFPNNTPLVAGAISGLTSYTLGGSQTYSLSPIDPDGVNVVTATLDGSPVALNFQGSTYSFATPTNLNVGAHTVSFSATGRTPAGVPETPVVVSQSITVLMSNTPLNLGAIAGPGSFTVGNAQTYSSVVTDPDGIVIVSATLDGNAISVAPSGSTYSITLPVSLAAGSHTVQFSAVGRRPDGSNETAQVLTRQIQVLTSNVALSISPISGLSPYVVGFSPTYSATIVDPDGIEVTSATLDGQPINLSNEGSTYSVVIPSVLALGQHTLVFSARGRTPGGGQEADQSTSFSFTVLSQNTPLSISAVSGPASINLRTIGTYSVTVTDPDGIGGVTAAIDGTNANVTRNGSVYSVQTPIYTTSGAHVVTFVATGQIPGGGSEASQSSTLGFNAQTPNTPINIGPISGPVEVTIGQTPSYTFVVTDPDGIRDVAATLNGRSLPVIVPNSGSTYSVQLPPRSSPGNYSLVVQAIGNIPGGTTETTQTQPFEFTVFNGNTLLQMGEIELGFTETAVIYRVSVVDRDGIFSVTASVDGQTVEVTRDGDIFSIVTQRFGTTVFNAVGLQPNGSRESVQTRTYIPG